MVTWGAVWFSLFALVVSVIRLDSVFDLAIYALLGAGAGAHLKHIVDARFAAFKALQQRADVNEASTPLHAAPDPVKAHAREYVPPLVTGSGSQAAPYISSSTEPFSPTKPFESKPVGPSAIERALAAAKGWLLGGNTVVRVGVVLLFIGLLFLAKFTAQMGLFPIELRLSLVALFGMGLLRFGFVKRAHVPQYALTLQGAGVAVLYLTLLAAMKGYELLPMPLTFGLMVLVCALGCALACLQNSQTLAFTAFSGGFAAPILLSTGQGSFIGLFGYYTVLNLAILTIALLKTWRPLNLLGFFSTFGVATAWGLLKFVPENYLPTQLYLIVFFMIYLLTPLLYAHNTAAESLQQTPKIDSTLIFGAPLVAFGLQVGLVKHFAFGAAYSALALAAIYVVLAFLLVRERRGYLPLLLECFVALGVGFLTLTIPLALDGQWIGVAWALEGLGAFWVGKRQSRWMPRAAGIALQGGALLSFLPHAFSAQAGMLFANALFLNTALLALSALVLAFWLREPLAHSDSKWAKWFANIEANLNTPFYVYGFGLAFFALSRQWLLTALGTDDFMGVYLIDNERARTYLVTATLLILAATSIGFGHKISRVAPTAIGLAAPTLLVVFLKHLFSHAAFSGLGWIFWPAAFALWAWMLHRVDGQSARVDKFLALIHSAGVWLLGLVVMQSVVWHLMDSPLTDTAWLSVAWLATLSALLIGLAAWAGRAAQQHFPLAKFQAAYLVYGAVPLAALTFISAVVVALTSSGNAAPLPYIPLLNPTDLSVALGAVALVFWRLQLQRADAQSSIATFMHSTTFWQILAALAFVFINTIWLRIAHHFFGINWGIGALFGSFIVQTGYALLWSSMALVTMLIAHQRGTRMLWMIGAGLLGLTIAKLMLIDLANRNGFERIVAFITVGLITLAIGYFAPVPPKKIDHLKDSND